MSKHNTLIGRLVGSLLLLSLWALPWVALQAAGHTIRGIAPVADAGEQVFNLYAAPFNISMPEGSSLYMWGFGDMNAGAGATHPEGEGYYLPQYPGPTMIVTEGQTVSVNLYNYGVPQPLSLVIPGHHVTATGGSPGLVTQRTDAGVSTTPVTYTFTAGKPGTYVYHSMDGENPGLHTEMGLLGALIVRPADGSDSAYGASTETDYDHEYLYLLTEADPGVHAQMERGHYEHFTNHERFATIYFVNGRVYPDLVQGDFNPLFPNQPYQSLSFSHPGDKILVRNANAGLDSHPFHYHGENHRFIGRDGNMLSSNGLLADLGRSDNTINSAPKQTVDAIWTWSGRDLGWDIFGTGPGYEHDCNGNSVSDGTDADFDPVTREYCPDHGKALPIDLPGVAELTLGGFWSGSPYLGDTGDLPPGEGGLNPSGGYFFVWHSHAEKELTTFDIFPGGSLSAVIILPTSVNIQ